MTETLDDSLPEALVPYLLTEGQGQKIVLFDQLFTLLTTGAQTERQFDAFVTVGRPGQAVPAHFHARTNETFFVLDGEVRLWIDDRKGVRETRILEAGGFGFVPRDTIHSYRIEKTARIFGVTSAGFTDFFRAVGRPTTTPGIPGPGEVHIPSFAEMGSRGAEHDVNFVPGYELFD
ncbi:Quercetin 2,3-dioxygenase [Microbacterium lemovicicum]|uniref:Quercetin 2,3-dioxygenase n=1 Tax=Microbacterium lemovicicum TaxID=1072463 RepID=A0A3Q9J0F3_9MICO|nr:quercetin 2,3-dioxygenase [Microbacterium lemovicicum]AZS38379.1 Quercetin 2,3-dioxygenase [Microbacterium lemovicicum]